LIGDLEEKPLWALSLGSQWGSSSAAAVRRSGLRGEGNPDVATEKERHVGEIARGGEAAVATTLETRTPHGE